MLYIKVKWNKKPDAQTHISNVLRHWALCFGFDNSSRIDGNANSITSWNDGMTLGLLLSALGLIPLAARALFSADMRRASAIDIMGKLLRPNSSCLPPKRIFCDQLFDPDLRT